MEVFFVIVRTPVKWLKFRPEKPMGEILEEGDKDDGEKKEGEEGADKPATSEKKDGATEEPAVLKEVFNGNRVYYLRGSMYKVDKVMLSTEAVGKKPLKNPDLNRIRFIYPH